MLIYWCLHLSIKFQDAGNGTLVWFCHIPVGTCPILFPIKSNQKKKNLQIKGNQDLLEINKRITCNVQRLDAINGIPSKDKNLSIDTLPAENLNPNFWIIKKIRYALSLIKNTIDGGKLIMTGVIALGPVCCLPELHYCTWRKSDINTWLVILTPSI